MRLLPAIAFAASLLLPAGLSAAVVTKDIEYGRAGGEILRLDASVPEGAGPFPVAILIHGGGWRRGDKSGSSTPGDNADISPWFASLTAGKFTWLSINYRLAPAHPWPACFEDVQTAIRWAKAHAVDFKGDPQRIVLIGHSAGGQLACLAALQADDATRVQAVVGFSAVTDLEHNLIGKTELGASLQNLFQLPATVSPVSLATLRAASPVQYVKAGLPPFLLVHGDADPGVSIQQSLAFQAKVRAAGGICDLITIKNGPHSLVAWEEIDTSYKARMVSWLQAHLRADPRAR